MKVKSLVGSLFKKETEINKKALDSLETDQKEMIQGIVELSDTTVKDSNGSKNRHGFYSG